MRGILGSARARSDREPQRARTPGCEGRPANSAQSPPVTRSSEAIAAAAARLIVDEGLNYGAAKTRARDALGLPPRTPLPENALVEAQVRAHIALFCAETQPRELAVLRDLALTWMVRLAALRPYVYGAVWNGTATRTQDIHLQLFCDDPKAAELALVNAGVRYDTQTGEGLRGRPTEILSFSARCDALGEYIGVHLAVYDWDDLRGALRPGPDGLPLRGDAAALRARMAAEAVHG